MSADTDRLIAQAREAAFYPTVEFAEDGGMLLAELADALEAAERERKASDLVAGDLLSERDNAVAKRDAVEGERDRALAQLGGTIGDLQRSVARAEAAEAQLAECRDARDFIGDEHLARAMAAEAQRDAQALALRKIVSLSDEPLAIESKWRRAWNIARAALAGVAPPDPCALAGRHVCGPVAPPEEQP